MTCNRTLRWYELIPVFSYLFQLGKCRRCAESISHQYPLVELITGLMFVLVAFHFYYILFFSPIIYILFVIIYVFVFSLLIVISVYDLRHKIIPDTLVYTFIVISFLSIFINYTSLGSWSTSSVSLSIIPKPLFILPSLLNIIAGPLLALPFAFLWLVSKGKWMGLGDAKLMLGIGWMLGVYQGLASVVLSFWIGAIISLFIMFFVNKKINMKTEIPFAPFLIISFFVIFLFNMNIFTLASIF